MSRVKEIDFRGIKIQISEKNYVYQKNKHVFERLADGSYERGEISLLLSEMHEDSTILDLGSSLGVLSCIIGKKMIDSSKMVCVEANPNLIEDLKNNIKLNNLNSKVIHGAVSSRKVEVEFNFNGLSLSGSIFEKKHLHNGAKKWGEYQRVKLKTITPIDLEEQSGLKFDTLSCDIEGEELTMLPEMIEYFKNFKLLVVEFHDWAQEGTNYKYSIQDVHDMYSKYFKIKKLGPVTCFYK